ncbi:DUF427 domain-containing protein [Aeromicrobium sp. 9AM]|uniref:DUF427 domain-containing protein n=1 Tax=Aeromicrobium sp. 9AM TaxID=2653126 RepID=UPI0012F30FA1|nr:DUF427 domain-containing protein [Aeromicrobium sp. 9AM]VXC02690.1 conserved hypothetical protein [Aeromicrobium sp. 9AM]
MTERPVENVWDYPRPPSIERRDEHLVVRLGGQVIADTTMSWRVCETSHPPTYYLPVESFVAGVLRPVAGTTVCEWKGAAAYFDLVSSGRTVGSAAWSYPRPNERFENLVDHVAIYPGKVDECTIDGEIVQAQEGDFYGGWITSRVSGPFKGAPGTLGW